MKNMQGGNPINLWRGFSEKMMMIWMTVLSVKNNKQQSPTSARNRSSSSINTSSIPISATVPAVLFIFILFFFGGAAYIYSRPIIIDSVKLTNSSGVNEGFASSNNTNILIPKKKPKRRVEIPLNCLTGNQTFYTCTTKDPMTLISSTIEDDSSSSSLSNNVCPDYFRWIHEDLKPWRNTGITSEMVMRAKRTANFRLVIVKGKAYVETYMKSFQSRDTFTLWGILQMLRRYPGKLPDLDMMFDCVDWPVVRSSYYLRHPNAIAPPPIFRYCGNDSTLDIVFPDWSFWGWPEINIKPWGKLLEELKEGNRRTKWIERDPYAYWKGNPVVAETRQDLLKCNASDKQEWNARLYAQDWGGESKKGFRESNLADQCTHRYKIYIEGSAWSVSEKYILACDSLTLIVKPIYYDFFTRSLVPLQHYWPVKENDKCRSIKFAVDYGNNNKQKVQNIGKAASNFIQEDLRMDYVYDYMFHLLKEYAKLLRFKPTIPPKAVEFCSETMVCPANGIAKEFMMESLVKYPSDTSPCTFPAPFDPPSLQGFVKEKEESIRKVEVWESQFWESQPK